MDRVQLDNDGDVRFINAQLSQHLQSVLEEVQPMIDIQLKSLSPEERVQHQTLIQQHLHEWIASVFECMTHNISIHGEPYDAHRVFPTTEPVEPFDATLYDAHIAHFQEYQTLEQILSKHRQQLPVHAAQVVQSTLDQERILLNDLLNSIIPDVVRANVNEKTAHEPLISEKMQADYASAMAQLVRLRRTLPAATQRLASASDYLQEYLKQTDTSQQEQVTIIEADVQEQLQHVQNDVNQQAERELLCKLRQNA